MILSKLSSPETHSSTNLHILRIKSFATKKVPEEQNHTSDHKIEPTKVDEALTDDGWILAMQDELNQFKRNDVWDLVPKLEHKNIIGTKWVVRNKLNEQGEVIRNKARLVAQGYTNKKALIILKLLLQLQDWKQSGYLFPMQ